jgi:hypothetical protein
MGQPYASHSGKVLRMGFSDVNSHVSWTGYEKTRPICTSVSLVAHIGTHGKHQHTSYDLRALEVLVRVQVAWRQRKVDAHQNQQEIDSPPHGACCEVLRGQARRSICCRGGL